MKTNNKNMKIVTIKIRENDRVLFAVDGKYWLLRPKKKDNKSS